MMENNFLVAMSSVSFKVLEQVVDTDEIKQDLINH